MKNAKSISDPLSSRCSGMVSGSPSQMDRPTTNVTSLRAARLTTTPPRHAIRKARTAVLPHCPGDTHASPLAATTAAIPKLVGLNTCFPQMRITNLLAMVMTAARSASPA
jgi:hypothetical protein